MKHLITLFFLAGIALHSLAQSPQKFSYQTIIRSATNQLVTNQTVSFKISILQGSATGTVNYSEFHTTLTNANGLATLQIGDGAILGGDFAAINWANGPHFLKSEIDLNGGSNFTISSTQQLLSVPYSLYSSNGITGASQSGDTLFLGNGTYFIIPGVSASNNGGFYSGITHHSCGANHVHNSAKTYGSLTDQQGNVYKTIVIGNQEWMAENLNTTIYQNGESIPNFSNSPIWNSLTSGACCRYNNDRQYDCPYGKLYNWFAVTDPRNICPAGWHVPNNTDWTTLIDFLDPLAAGGTINENVAGGKLKSAGFEYWINPNQDATNESGFSGLPGGLRVVQGNFDYEGSSGFWWSSSDMISPPFVSNFRLDPSNGVIYSEASLRQAGLSVRCVKD
jgi:uncharacterized protein (TIGR02145 family)